jgi:DNA topoisomerase-1
MSYDAYCMGCKAQRPIQEPRIETMRNGRPATRGVCGTCGTGLYLLGDATKKE